MIIQIWCWLIGMAVETEHAAQFLAYLELCTDDLQYMVLIMTWLSL